MEGTSPDSEPHSLRPMRGRDPHESGRVATTLELLCDLTFVVAFSFAGSGLAHAIENGHAGAGLAAFALAMFAVLLAWVNFAWFSSAFDNDDWGARLATMVQMLGVLILAVGLAPMFESVERGGVVERHAIVLGYVVMRVALVVQWLRVARQDPRHRAIAMTYARSILVAQVAWCATLLLKLDMRQFALLALPLGLLEMAIPVFAERNGRTPWHPHHIAERYGLLAIIALGEVIVATATILSAETGAHGWSVGAGMAGLAGVGLALGMWWVYFILPFAQVLHRYGNRKAYGWGYAHFLIFPAIAAVGAGLHVAASTLGGAHGAEHAASPLIALGAVAIPLALYVFAIYALYAWMVERFDAYHIRLLVLTAAFLLLPFAMLRMGASLPTCLLALVAVPLVSIVGYERHGHRHIDESLARMHASSDRAD